MLLSNGKTEEWFVNEKNGETSQNPVQTEGFRAEGVGEWGRLVMGSKEGTCCMVHWVYTPLMNHGTLHQKPGMYCMVTNII